MRIAYGSNLPVDPSKYESRIKSLENKTISIPSAYFVNVPSRFFNVNTVEELNNDKTLFPPTDFRRLYDYYQVSKTLVVFVIDKNDKIKVTPINTMVFSAGDILTVRFIVCGPILQNNPNGISRLKYFDISLDRSTNTYTEFSKKDIPTL